MSNVNPELVKILKRKIFFEEKKNLKEKENKRAQMIDKIKRIVEEEVNKW